MFDAREGCAGANAIQGPKIVDWDLTKGFKTLKELANDSRAEEHSKQWQILVHFSSFVMST